MGVLALVLGAVILKDHRTPDAPRSFDVPGIALLSAAMFCLIWALIKARDWSWGDSRTLLFLGAAVLAFVLFAVWETRSREPLLPLGLFRSLALSAGTVLMLLMAFAFIGGLFFVTFYLQNVHGMSPVDSGLHLLPLTGMMIVAAPVAGAVITRVGPRIPLVAGMLSTAVACFGMAYLKADTGTGLMSLWFALLGIGLSPVMVGATEVIVGNAPLQHAGGWPGAATSRHAGRRLAGHRGARRGRGRPGRPPAAGQLGRCGAAEGHARADGQGVRGRTGRCRAGAARGEAGDRRAHLRRRA
ncbi:hypothetical protein GCM10020000_56670 [Streptomyces olivoverticillatus]